MNASTPIVIVGAGLAGAATAYHLRAQGAQKVILLEQGHAPGREASGHSAAILRERMESPELADWARASAAALRDLGVVRPCGGFEIDDGAARASNHVAHARGTGTHLPADGVVDVPALLALFLDGLFVHANTPVFSYEPAGEGLLLRTSRGTLESGILVNATGAFAGAFGNIAAAPTKRHIFVSEPDDRIDANAPYVWDLRAGYYFRPETGGWMLCACDETPCAPEDDAIDPAAESRLRAKFREHQPHLADVSISRAWNGHRTFAPDRLPLIGWDAHTPGLFHVAALGGHGVTLSHEVGRHAAACILGTEGVDVRFTPKRLVPEPAPR